jgi:hypothetical protein
MDFPTFQAELRRIAGHVQAFAAIGAAARLYQVKQQAHPAVQARLIAAVEAVLPVARTSAASSRSPMTVQGWLLRSRAAFSMSARALGRWR